MSTPIVPADRLECEVVAQACDLHPELPDRSIAPGGLEAGADDTGRRWFDRSQVAVGRILRLRSGLRQSCAAILDMTPVIDRVDESEDAVRLREADRARRRSSPPEPGGRR